MFWAPLYLRFSWCPVNFFGYSFSLPLNELSQVGLALDLVNCPSVLWRCWLGNMTRKIVTEWPTCIIYREGHKPYYTYTNDASASLPSYLWPRATLTFDLLHPSYCDTVGIHMRLLVKFVVCVLKYLDKIDFCDLLQCHETLSFDLWPPKLSIPCPCLRII